MGIRGLTTYFLNNWRICEHINIEENINYKIILVDGNSFIYWFYNYFNFNFNFDYILINKIIFKYLNMFLKYNIQLIFIFDGFVQLNKLSCKLERLLTQSQSILISSSSTSSSDINNQSNNRMFSSNPLPLLAIETIIQCLKENCVYINEYKLPIQSHCYHIVSSGEADKLIVDLAIKFHAFGILSNDSDMLIYNQFPNDLNDIYFIPFWSLQYNLDESTLGMYLVKREKFAKLLHIPPEVMIYYYSNLFIIYYL